MNRKKKLYLNTVSALILQIVTFICGFILPKQILLFYGSEVNGLVISISRFLSVISLLEMVKDQTARFGMEQFYLGPETVVENEYVPTSDVASHPLMHLSLIHI